MIIENMEAKIDLKICCVCGDKALGYNFNAVTCESCKAFFRRNALVNKHFKCPFNNKCEITTVTRRFCQKCRLEKCFAIGMRKDYIMSEEDKVLKRRKIENNKTLKRTTSNGFKRGFKKIKKDSIFNEDSQESMDDSVKQEYSDYSSPEGVEISSQDDALIRTILNPTPNGSVKNSSEEEASPIGNILMNNNDFNSNNIVTEIAGPISTHNNNNAKDILEEVQRIQAQTNSMESILCEAIKLEFEAYPSIAQHQGNSRELNDAERAKLNELIVANKALMTPLDDDLSAMTFHQKPLTDPALVDVINLTAVAIRRLIKMAKKINGFKNMCQEDQIALLKGGCTEMMILRSLMNYDSSKQTWRIPHTKDELSSLKTDILKQAKGNIYQEHERFMTTFDPKWRTDENIILILCAISLFTPDRQRVIHQDVIKLEQNSYYYLLRRYLESVYPGCEAKSTFLKLIQKISELHKVNEEVINCYLDVNPSEVEPLLIEIFDLKH